MVLVLIRLSSLCVFAPVLSSTAVPVRVKAAFTIALALLISPVASRNLGSAVELTSMHVAGEISVGCIFGLSLSFLAEALTFAGMLIGMQFSFSLVNLLDPNTMVDNASSRTNVELAGNAHSVECWLAPDGVERFYSYVSGCSAWHGFPRCQYGRCTCSYAVGGFLCGRSIGCARYGCCSNRRGHDRFGQSTVPSTSCNGA